MFGNNIRHGVTKGVPSKRNGREVVLNKNDTINVIIPNENKSKFTRRNITTLGVDEMCNDIIG